METPVEKLVELDDLEYLTELSEEMGQQNAETLAIATLPLVIASIQEIEGRLRKNAGG
jgi:hypothetical protein